MYDDFVLGGGNGRIGSVAGKGDLLWPCISTRCDGSVSGSVMSGGDIPHFVTCFTVVYLFRRIISLGTSPSGTSS